MRLLRPDPDPAGSSSDSRPRNDKIHLGRGGRASAYHIWVSTFEDLSNPLIYETITEIIYAPTYLKNDRTCFWQVEAKDVFGNQWSAGSVMDFVATAKIQLMKDIRPLHREQLQVARNI